MRLPVVSVLILVGLFSGCLFGGNAANTAQQLSGVRGVYVEDGSLVPPTSEREQYRNEILPFRNTINSIGGNDGAALKAYLNGTLSLLDLAHSTDEALGLLENVNLDAPECGTNSPITKTIALLDNAQASAQSSHDYFTAVQDNVAMTNTLGADYVLNAVQTTQAVAQTHAQRVKELKTACGFSV